MSNGGNKNVLSELLANIQSVQTQLQKSSTRLVRAKAEISALRELTQTYFRTIRQDIALVGLDSEPLDLPFGTILELTNRASQRSSYVDALRRARKKASEMEVQYEFALSEGGAGDELDTPIKFSDQENQIIKILKQINPFFSDAYTQIILDLSDQGRISYRGAVHEMRELLRGILNHFAPDAEVEAQANFSFERGQKKPTRTQKMKFILSSRNQSSAQIEPAKKATRFLDVQTEILSLIPNAVYSAGSDSAHADPRELKREVLSLKRYLDAVLCDILEIN